MADARGSGEAIQRVLEATGNRDVQAIVLVWNLSDGRGGAEGCGLPAYWVPEPADAPVSDYLREAYNMEVVHPLIHGVHGTAAFGPDQHVLFAGLGGEISDDPNHSRDELERLSYPRWEAEYRLKLLRELEEHQMVLVSGRSPRTRGSARPEASCSPNSSTPTGLGSSSAAATPDCHARPKLDRRAGQSPRWPLCRSRLSHPRGRARGACHGAQLRRLAGDGG